MILVGGDIAAASLRQHLLLIIQKNWEIMDI